MDTNELLAHSRARFDHNTAKQTLKEKYQAKMVFAHAGGLWQAGPELNNTLSTCGIGGKIVLLDLYDNPVKVDSTELLALSQYRWQEQMNAWMIEYEQISKIR